MCRMIGMLGAGRLSASPVAARAYEVRPYNPAQDNESRQ
jgi:hypothetical protein